MHICIFQTGEPLHIDSGNYRPMRAMLLANELIKNGHEVTILSSSFFHQRKIFRSKNSKLIIVNEKLKIILINSCGYKNHIGIKRILDHLILSVNLFKFLKRNKSFKPHKVFLGYPPIETSFVIIRWAKKNNIPVMLDVKDNWPENFLEPFPKYFKNIAKLLLLPYFKLAKYIFQNSDYISSITESFINWIHLFSTDKFVFKDSQKTKYLIAPLVRKKIVIHKKQTKESLDFWKSKGIDILKGNHFSFVGSLSNAFDFKFIYKLSRFLNSYAPNYIFVICGTGEKYEKLKYMFKDSKNVFIFGEVNKYRAALLIRNSIATLAPYKNNPNFKNSIPNKVIESLENSVPFITNTEGELENLIKKYENGIFIGKNNRDILKIIRLTKDKEYLKILRKNAGKSYKNLFSFNKTYQNIILKLSNL